MADDRSEAQLAGAATWAGGATCENADRERSWRRRSVDSKIERTTCIAAARDAPTTGARVETARRVESRRDDASRSPFLDSEPPPVETRARAFDPPLAVEVSDLSLWVRPAFGGGTKTNTPFGVFRGARAPGAPKAVREPSGDDHRQRTPPLDVEKAEGTVRGARALASRETGASGSEEEARLAGKRKGKKTDAMVRVLRDVSFEAVPGETTAILGPSGSGKTSLVTAIAGRLSTRRGEYAIEGDVCFVEAPLSSPRDEASKSADRRSAFGSDKSLSRRVGFVTQDDCLFPSLTVAETVRYAAALRLPDDDDAAERRTPSAEREKEDSKALPSEKRFSLFAAFARARAAARAKAEAADAVIEALGLDRARDTPVGGAFAFPGRGVSGGERKRVAVAVELLTEPSVLILDEPTSGLDSTVALRLVRTLADLAKGGLTFRRDVNDTRRRDVPHVDDRRTVLLTIHQPSSRVVRALDATLFLARGRRAFYGDACGIQRYFAAMNAHQDFFTNPAEFCVDLCNGEIGEYVGAGERANVAVVGDEQEQSSENENEGEQKTFMLLCTDDVDRVVDVVAARSAACGSGRVGRDGTVRVSGNAFLDGADRAASSSAASKFLVGTKTEPKETEPPSTPSPPRWAVSWCAQTRALLRRSLAARRGAFFDALKIAQVVVVALLVGVLWFQRGERVGVAAVSDVAGALFFELLFLSFLTLFGSLFTFPDERAVICKERQSGAVRVSAYFVARALADVPLDLSPPTLFVAVAYGLVGLKPSAGAFFEHLFLTYLAVLVASSLGLFIGATFPATKRAQTVASVVMLSVMLTGGFYFDETPAWLDWTKRTSFVNHAYAALLKTQFPDGGAFKCHEHELEALRATEDATEDAFASFDARRSGKRVVATCRVEDTGQLEFVDLRESVWVNVGALLCVFLALRLATYLALRFVTLKPR